MEAVRFQRRSKAEKIARDCQQENEELRLAGCKCGAPATVVQYFGLVAFWTCEEHQGVNQWDLVIDEDGNRTMMRREQTPEQRANLTAWETSGPRPYSQVDALRGGAFEVNNESWKP